MNQELWWRPEELFHAALGRSPQDRRAFLDEAYGGDAELRRDVESLVSNVEQAGSFLEKPLRKPFRCRRGAMVGRYRLKEKQAKAEWALPITHSMLEAQWAARNANHLAMRMHSLRVGVQKQWKETLIEEVARLENLQQKSEF